MNQLHSTWLTFVVQQFSKLAPVIDLRARLLDHLEVVLALALLDLEPARPTLESCYAQRKGGRSPRDPVAMLRCLVLMGLLGITSFNEFVKRLRRRVELVVLCGFEPDDAPGASTIYDFCHRLLDGPREQLGNVPERDTPPPSEQLQGSRGRFRRNPKLEFRTFHLLRRARNGRCGVIAPIFSSTYYQYAFAENSPDSLQRLAPDASSLRQKARNSSSRKKRRKRRRRSRASSPSRTKAVSPRKCAAP